MACLIKDLIQLRAEIELKLHAGLAVKSALTCNGLFLQINGRELRPPFYAVALGKAAYPMALAIEEIAPGLLSKGVVSGLPQLEPKSSPSVCLSEHWQMFAGGHPFPNQASLQAADAAIALMKCANTQRATVIFMISGGGSAMMEKPIDERISLEDIQLTNKLLVNCGASIAEINAVRQAISAVKGGGLARLAPNAVIVNLIVSDTPPRESAYVASGPTITPPSSGPKASDVIKGFDLAQYLPSSVSRVLNTMRVEDRSFPIQPDSDYCVLLDQNSVAQAVFEAARELGWDCVIADDINDQNVVEGTDLLAKRLQALCDGANESQLSHCLGIISVGEFACPVRGSGKGGRNSETALRLALLFDNLRDWFLANDWEVAAICCGTDGVDGNSPANGAIATSETITRSKKMGLDAEEFLARSDSYSFFTMLGDAIITGPTFTNLRDIRVLVASRKRK